MASEQVMNEQEAEGLIHEIYEYVAQQFAEGHANGDIENDLIERGLDPELAQSVVSDVALGFSNAQKEAGKRDMLVGGLFCLGGILITALTYSSASQGGGTYVVTWGAILFGAIQFFRGLMKYSD